MVELVFRDDDNFTHCVPAVSPLVGCDDVDFVETPDCRWILNAETIGVLLVAAVLAIKNSIARKKVITLEIVSNPIHCREYRCSSKSMFRIHVPRGCNDQRCLLPTSGIGLSG
jgi:hypothetical protein